MSFLKSSNEAEILSMCACAVFGTLLVKIMEIVVTCPQDEVVQRVECLDGTKDFVLNNLIIQLLVFVAVPFTDTQPILTVTEGVHPLVHDAAIQQVIDGQMHVTEVRAAPETQA